MVGKIKRGKNFKAVCDYLLDGDKEIAPEIIGGNMVSTTSQDLAVEFSMFTALNRRVKVPVKHFSLSFAPGDGEISDEIKCNLAADYMERMGYGHSQYLVVSHSRTDHDHDHDHIHIVANAVDLDGNWVNDRLDWKRSQTILRDLEREYDLTPVISSWDKNRDKFAATRTDRRFERLLAIGTQPTEIERVRAQIQTKISQAVYGAKTMTEFCARLQSLGVSPIPRITRTGIVLGLSYQQGDVVIRGSDLDQASFPALQSRGVDYEIERDLYNLKTVLKGGQIDLSEPWNVSKESMEIKKSQPVSVPTYGGSRQLKINSQKVKQQGDNLEISI
jgi:hypothetical protein